MTGVTRVARRRHLVVRSTFFLDTNLLFFARPQNSAGTLSAPNGTTPLAPEHAGHTDSDADTGSRRQAPEAEAEHENLERGAANVGPNGNDPLHGGMQRVVSHGGLSGKRGRAGAV